MSTTKNLIDPKIFGLNHTTIIEKIDDKTLALLITRKSRLIMADGKKIAEKVKKIRNIQPEVQVILKHSAPICSKTVQFLDKMGIAVQSI